MESTWIEASSDVGIPAHDRSLLSEPRPVDDVLPPGHPYRRAIEETLANRQSSGPWSAHVPDAGPDRAGEGKAPSAREQIILTDAIEDMDRHRVAVMLVDPRRGPSGPPPVHAQ